MAAGWSEHGRCGVDDELKLLSLRDAAEVLGLDWKVVRELVETGEIGAYFTGSSRQPRIPRRALAAWQERIAQRAPLLSKAEPRAIRRARA